MKEAELHDIAYFEQTKPLISDFAYDQLIKQIEEIEREHPDWVAAVSPTQKVSERPTKGFIQVAHRVPMLSLTNTYSEEELLDFVHRVYKLTGKEKIPFCCEIKMDGVALTIRYEKGELVQGLTRGDGKKGDDITANLRMISSVPKKLNGKKIPAILEVRGEAFMTHRAFQEANERKEEEGLEPWANPRNATAGSLKLLDQNEVKERNLSVVFYGIADDAPGLVKSQFECHELLESFGFPTTEKSLRRRTEQFEEILSFAREIESKRKQLGFDIDGVVIKLDDLPLWSELGATGKSPRWAVAFKFAPEQVETVVEEITVQVGRTGVLTPVAELKPVLLAGSRISRATLHNQDEVERKDIRIGDTVTIEKGGDVIPKVVLVDFKKRPEGTTRWKMPAQCPICHTPVTHLEGEVAFRCPNPNCGEQVLRRITFFASKGAMDIDHMGPKVVQQLVNRGLVTSIADIYELTREDLALLDGFKEKSIDNLMQSIEKSKRTTLPRLIFSLGIKHVGQGVAELLAAKGGSIDAIAQMSVQQLIEIEGIGEKVAESVVSFFSAPAQRNEVERLIALGITPQSQTRLEGHPFSGKTFVLTGTLTRLSRTEATNLVKERGGSVSSSVGKKTDYLLLGEDPGSKHDKAKELGITILSEDEFEKLL